MPNRIYLDNAATTKVYPHVASHMNDIIQTCYGNPSSIHAEGRMSKSILEDARKTIASLLNASTGEIYFTSGGTESNNIILNRSISDQGVERIISTPIEHPSVYNVLLQMQTSRKVDIVFLDVDHKGNIDYNQLSNLLQSQSAKTLVSIMHANNELGTMYDIEEIGRICHENNALFHTDVTQSIAKHPIDLDKLNVNFLAASAHKFHGPKGVGILYVNNENVIQPLMYGGGQERNIRSGTENIASASGMAMALEHYIQNQKATKKHLEELRTYLKKQLVQEFDDIHFNGDQENYLYTILSVSFPKTPKTDLITFQLDIEGIAASAGSACSSGTEKASYVLSAINFPENRKAVRFSFSADNTVGEIDRLLQVLKKILVPTHINA